MYQTFLQITVFLLCINTGIFVVEQLVPSVPLTSPFDNTKTIGNVTKSSFGNLYNATNNTGTISNQIDNPTNSTTNKPLDWYIDWFNISLSVVQTMLQILFGGFLAQALGLFGYPSAFFVGIYAIQGFFLIITAVYYVTGKGL